MKKIATIVVIGCFIVFYYFPIFSPLDGYWRHDAQLRSGWVEAFGLWIDKKGLLLRGVK